MIFRSLASSSGGNAYIVADDQTRLLLEAGVGHRKLQKLAGFALSDFQGGLVSHEHKDHCKAVEELLSRGMPVYMSRGTAEALWSDRAEEDGEEIAPQAFPSVTTAHKGPRNDIAFLEAVTEIRSMEQFSIGTLDIVPFAVFHDAREPLGFLIKSRLDGDVLAFATDTVNLRYRFPGVNILAIEANYDQDILARCQKMPEKVRYRITNSHMEIDTLCDYLRGLDLSRCREVILLHLSDATSHEGHFINKVARCVPGWVTVTAAGK